MLKRRKYTCTPILSFSSGICFLDSRVYSSLTSALAVTGSGDTTGKSHSTTPEYLEKRLRARRKSGTALLQGTLLAKSHA